jgi:hypothetical protein
MVMPPPATTAAVGPSRNAASPDSNAPSWLEALMNTISTAVTRPRSSSGVASAAVVERMFIEYMSAYPVATSAANDSGALRERPNTTVATPNAATATSSVRPAPWRIGRRVRPTAAPSAPMAGAARRMPSPVGPTCRIDAA